MQTILGAGGAIGNQLAQALTKYTGDIRIVSRTPEKVNTNDKLVVADLTYADQVEMAVEGSDVVYLTVGLPYKLKIWQALWPVIMKNVIDACKKHRAKLVFFDNIYMYDPKHLGHMTEETPVAPVSKKGVVRVQLVRMLEEAVERGAIEALIARCADYYGPSVKGTSVLTEVVFNNFAKGKKAQWLGNPDCKHSFTYTPDAGKATAMLGNTPDAFNQTWHLPTASPAKTGRELIELIAREMGVKPRIQAAGKPMVRILGVFVPLMREMVEMLYQYESDYVFDSSKFENRFDFEPTSYSVGVAQIARIDYGK